uniref:Uncharacterized protein n=1 Tax=Plectus sambesii TaxID=2011161 RepID=A0A914UKI6_9BILA
MEAAMNVALTLVALQVAVIPKAIVRSEVEMEASHLIAEVATMVELEAIMVWEALEVDQEAILVDLVEKELQLEAVAGLVVETVLAALVELMALKAQEVDRMVGKMEEAALEDLEALEARRVDLVLEMNVEILEAKMEDSRVETMVNLEALEIVMVLVVSRIAGAVMATAPPHLVPIVDAEVAMINLTGMLKELLNKSLVKKTCQAVIMEDMQELIMGA